MFLKRRSVIHPDLFYLLALLGALFLFFPGLFNARTAALTADHWQQHYPWAQLLSRSVKEGVLPFWTGAIQCGFPIAAESQIGIFYLPNLLFSYFLPLSWAYSYTLVFHFLTASFGMYFYARYWGMSRTASLFAANLFLFGAACGGAYYNITSLKTLCWFPWQLLAFDFFFDSRRFRHLLTLAFLFSLSFLAGYLQVAAFALVIAGFYALCRIFIFRKRSAALEPTSRAAGCFGFSAAVAGAVFLALPQLLLTYPLAAASNRTGLGESYAYIGSLSPLTVVTFLFPYAHSFFRSNCFYMGLAGLFFLLAGFYSNERKTDFFRLWCSIGIFSLLLALGQWSPLYVGIIKLTQFYSFRVPAKFIFFVNFSLCLLSAYGFEAFLLRLKRKESPSTFFSAPVRLFRAVAGAGVFLWCGAGILLVFMRTQITQAGEWFLENYFVGKPGRPHSMNVYQEKLNSYLDSVQSILSLNHPWTLWSLLLILLHVFLLTVLVRSVKFSKVCLLALSILAAADLYVYSWINIRGDLSAYTELNPENPLRSALRSAGEQGRLGRIYGFRRPEQTLPLIPSANMLDDIEDIGIYSPFVSRRYYETVGLFGNIDDSTHMQVPEGSFVLARLPFLRALGVTHVLAAEPFNDDALTQLKEDSGRYLYALPGSLQQHAYLATRIEVLSDWESVKSRLLTPNFDPAQTLLLARSDLEDVSDLPPPASDAQKGHRGSVSLLSDEPHQQIWQIETSSACFFVNNETWDAGWSAQVNGRDVPILKAYGLFRAVSIPSAGQYQIVFRYNPWGFWGRLLTQKTK